MTTRIEMLNRALLRIGADPLESEDDTVAPVHLAVFDSTAEFLAGIYPWTFLKLTRRLPRLVAAPEQHYQYAFQLPPERTGAIRAVYPSAEVRRASKAYHIEGERLLTDLPEVWVTFMSLRSPAYWPGDFREGFTLLLMSELSFSIREDQAARDRLRVNALGTPQEQPLGGLIGQAAHNDSQAEPSDSMDGDDNPLIDVRG